MTKSEYRDELARRRKALRNHVSIVMKREMALHAHDVADWMRHKRLPEYLQYQAVSDVYLVYMAERIADYGGMMWEREMESKASRYFSGL